MSTLILHSSAFGLFLVSTVVGYSSYTLYVIDGDHSFYFKVLPIWYFVSAISQVLLCLIFWELSSFQHEMV